ncbi:hypothetical protein H4219_000372 [Mycoemilia scoparia]|uniref:Uncharacterized protein n=1 Tax=Mycoemilia scoparia TaxID=417184 RepID=A0A9W8A909_9FUNG|nr:hypothetical protein H4219_000372 [Mycoemilia scoparia]
MVPTCVHCQEGNFLQFCEVVDRNVTSDGEPTPAHTPDISSTASESDDHLDFLSLQLIPTYRETSKNALKTTTAAAAANLAVSDDRCSNQQRHALDTDDSDNTYYDGDEEDVDNDAREEVEDVDIEHDYNDDGDDDDASVNDLAKSLSSFTFINSKDFSDLPPPPSMVVSPARGRGSTILAPWPWLQALGNAY